MPLEVQPPDGPVRRHRWVTVLAMAIVIVALVALIAGCGAQDAFNDDRGKGDAPVGETDDSEAEVINMPNEFANIAHKCDGHGHRVYTTTHGGGPREIAVIDDPSCPGGEG